MFFGKKGLLNNQDSSKYTIETLYNLIKDQQIIIQTLQKHVTIVETSLDDLRNFIDLTIDNTIDDKVMLKDSKQIATITDTFKKDTKDLLMKYALKIDAPQNDAIKDISDKINFLEAKIVDQTIHIKSIESFLLKGPK